MAHQAHRRLAPVLERNGWEREGWPDVVFAFHDGAEIGPRMLARTGRQTGLAPDDL
jgi:hypothetical protein